MLMLLDSLSHGKLRLNTKCLLYMYDALFAVLNLRNCRRKLAKMWKESHNEYRLRRLNVISPYCFCHLNHIYRVRYPCINLRINCVSFNELEWAIPHSCSLTTFLWLAVLLTCLRSNVELCQYCFYALDELEKKVAAGKWRGSPFFLSAKKNIQRIR